MQADSLWYWSYLANIKIALSGWPASPEYLGHFWSLAVEEQFYMFWPLLVLALSPRAMLHCCAVLIVAALGVRVALLAAGEVTAANVLTPARLDALAIGGLVALLARKPGGLARMARWNLGVGLACGAIVIGLYGFYRGLPAGTLPVATVGYTALAGLFASTMVAALLAPASSRLARLWSARPLVFFGKYSYALYVVHPAVIYFWPAALTASALHEVTGRWIIAFACASALMLAASVGVALISWHGLEKHFLRLRFRYADAGSTTASREAFIPSNAQSATLPVRR
jgi:peptidoglycan/LPS O-acetylase OafA/YrhL